MDLEAYELVYECRQGEESLCNDHQEKNSGTAALQSPDGHSVSESPDPIQKQPNPRKPGDDSDNQADPHSNFQEQTIGR